MAWTWNADGRTGVTVRIGLERWVETTFVGVSVPIERVHRSVFLPDGGLAKDARASFATWCLAVSDESEPVVRVRVSLEGYEDLSFSFDPREPIPARTLQRTVGTAAR